MGKLDRSDTRMLRTLPNEMWMNWGIVGERSYI